MKCAGLITIALLYTQLIFPQQWNLHENLAPDDRKKQDYFGTDVSAYHEQAIAGAYYNNTDAGGFADLTNAGAAYIYEWNPATGSWEQQQKLTASNRSVKAYFGKSVAIHTNIALVGAPGTQAPNLGQGTKDEAGAAYIFQKQLNGTWTEVAALLPPVRYENAEFGNAVAIDPPYALVGAFQDGYDESDSNKFHFAGAAYLYKKDENGNWNFHQKLVANDRFIIANFGISVDIENNTLAIGAEREGLDTNGVSDLGAGAVYLFEPDINDEWKQVQKLVSEDRKAQIYFGSSVKLNGDQMIVGAKNNSLNEAGDSSVLHSGAAYILEKDTSGTWNIAQKLTAMNRNVKDNFGDKVDISGNACVIGANERRTDENGQNSLFHAGSAYVFVKQSTGKWEEQHNVFPLDRQANDRFGYAVAMNNNYIFASCFGDDGTEIGLDSLLGAGSIYVYKTSTPVGVAENELPGELELFPNPATSYFTIKTKKVTQMNIFDTGGRIVLNRQLQPGQNEIDISDFDAGLYMVTTRETGRFSRLIIHR